MSGKNLLIVVALVILGMGAYWWYTQQGGYQTPTPPTVPQPSPTTPTPTEKTITLSQQNNSGESGTAILKELGGKVVVTLNLTGAPIGVQQPAHIHAGTCAKIGAVKYPLTFPTDGWSETSLDTTIDKLMSELPLALNVHKSKDQASVYVSCGDIK